MATVSRHKLAVLNWMRTDTDGDQRWFFAHGSLQLSPYRRHAAVEECCRHSNVQVQAGPGPFRPPCSSSAWTLAKATLERQRPLGQGPCRTRLREHSLRPNLHLYVVVRAELFPQLHVMDIDVVGASSISIRNSIRLTRNQMQTIKCRPGPLPTPSKQSSPWTWPRRRRRRLVQGPGRTRLREGSREARLEPGHCSAGRILSAATNMPSILMWLVFGRSAAEQ